ncbi:hypothetical protein BAE44_0026166 [Dichanthelium oligosanthes]|uniref:Transcription repressor n=1 Tax=Dichanthelium oligosanthes TaxID=888268 RepID=A0A1E5UJ46_9POAL|nr:hypothetical protein BAE44_0026166 [Dichanthelium oligosanthes]
MVSMRHDSDKHEEEYKTTMNPAYALDYYPAADNYSCNLSYSSATLSTAPEPEPAAVADEDEVIIHGLRSNSRLFFELDSTSSIVKKQRGAAAFDGAMALAIESADPYGDFRRSLEEMVLSHGVNDWGWLEEMLSWYLRANDKKTHGLILGAFVDLLVALASSAPSPSPAACSSSFKQNHLQPAKNGKQSDVTSALGQYACMQLI